MKLFKRITSAIISVAMATTFAIGVAAASQTAFIVGVNYYESASDTTADNFVTNATNASNAYASISGLSRVRTQYPTKTSLTNHVNDNVIFLNSHANYDRIIFKYKNASGTFVDVGYTSGSSSKYINLSNCDMSNVKLITFAGCKTADTSESDNITKTAVESGADCAVGFTNTITSRSTSGKAWLKTYNESLASGYTVGRAISNAASNNSTSDLAKYVYMYGNGQSITSSSDNSLIFDNESEIETAENNITAKASDILISDTTLNEFMYSYDNNFNANDYKYYVNIFDEKNNTGIIVFNHYINDEIITNKSYVIYIENGYVADISKSNVDKNISEDIIFDKAMAFSSQYEIEEYSYDTSNILNIKDFYEYNYNTNELENIKVVYSIGDSGEIIENVTETIIEG